MDVHCEYLCLIMEVGIFFALGLISFLYKSYCYNEFLVDQGGKD